MSENYFSFSGELDREFLGSIYPDNSNHAEIVFENFLTYIHPELVDIEFSYNAADIETFRMKIHKLSPVLSYVGLTTLTAQADLIEENCINNSGKQELASMYSTFKSELKRMIPVIEQEYLNLKVFNYVS